MNQFYGYFEDVASSGSRSVAVGYQTNVFESDDGISWMQVGTGFVSGTTVAWGVRRFFTCDVFCATSTDATTWRSAAMLPVGMVASGLAWGGTRWVAVGTNGAIATSP